MQGIEAAPLALLSFFLREPSCPLWLMPLNSPGRSTHDAADSPPIPRHSQGQAGRGFAASMPSSHEDLGAQKLQQARGSPRVILSPYVWGSAEQSAEVAAEDFLPRNLRLPDERPRLREGDRDARAGRLPASRERRAGRPGALQHVLDPRQGRAESVQPPLRLQEI